MSNPSPCVKKDYTIIPTCLLYRKNVILRLHINKFIQIMFLNLFYLFLYKENPEDLQVTIS